MGSNPTICELDPTKNYLDEHDTPCDGPPVEEFRQHSTRVQGQVVPLPHKGVWGARCNRHSALVDRELNEARPIVRQHMASGRLHVIEIEEIKGGDKL